MNLTSFPHNQTKVPDNNEFTMTNLPQNIRNSVEGVRSKCIGSVFTLVQKAEYLMVDGVTDLTKMDLNSVSVDEALPIFLNLETTISPSVEDKTERKYSSMKILYSNFL